MTVYPRVRGGTKPGKSLLKKKRGLSPRARGNQIFWIFIEFSPRSIPACAGEPVDISDFSGFGVVYPRVRGGTSVKNATSTARWGLSPRARGNPA